MELGEWVGEWGWAAGWSWVAGLGGGGAGCGWGELRQLGGCWGSHATGWVGAGVEAGGWGWGGWGWRWGWAGRVHSCFCARVCARARALATGSGAASRAARCAAGCSAEEFPRAERAPRAPKVPLFVPCAMYQHTSPCLVGCRCAGLSPRPHSPHPLPCAAIDPAASAGVRALQRACARRRRASRGRCCRATSSGPTSTCGRRARSRTGRAGVGCSGDGGQHQRRAATASGPSCGRPLRGRAALPSASCA